MAALRNGKNMLARLGYLNRRQFASVAQRSPRLNVYGITTEKALSWSTTGAVWGATGLITLIYLTDWEQVIQYIPFVKNKIPPRPKEEEE